MKPWHFGALSGLAMCHQQLGNTEEVQKCLEDIMPKPGQRESWVQRMVSVLDERISDLTDFDNV